ncbi:MAG TPA: response regulator [Phycisphaerales bacterium]|nr:response regulator [Phycisphaerales bacterium]
MQDKSGPIVYVAEQERGMAHLMKESLAGDGVLCVGFIDGHSCLQELRTRLCDVLITDSQLPDMHAITLIGEVLKICPCLPVIVRTPRSDIAATVLAMKGGAFEAIEEDADVRVVLPTVRAALGQFPEGLSRTMKPLTRIEHKVLSHVLEGKGSGEIALAMKRSRRTIEAHRCRILKKLGVRNVAELCCRVPVRRLGQ